MLDKEELLDVVRNAPLAAIDLLVRSADGGLLVGKRSNEPAAGTWFVPGGRIRKGESIAGAFQRIVDDELGIECELRSATLVNAYDHLYDLNFAEAPGVGTHYVTLAYEIRLDSDLDLSRLPTTQHTTYRWAEPGADDDNVHPNCIPYLATAAQLSAVQYRVLNARRDEFNTLLWKTPALSLVAQAFLLGTILDSSSSNLAIVIAAALAMAVSMASWHLLDKHRQYEETQAQILHDYERVNGAYPMNRKVRFSGWARISAYRIWAVLLPTFGLAALLALVVRLWPS